MPILASDIESFEIAFEKFEGFKPFNLYCSVTGKPIGRLDGDEIANLLEQLSEMAIEDQINDWSLRLVASMRPSMRWNKFGIDSLEQARLQAPTELMCYLLNRMWNKSRESFLLDSLGKIKMFKFWQWQPIGGPIESELLPMLLELDARIGLHNLSCPIARSQLLDSPTAFTDEFTRWYKQQISKLRADELEARFVRANPLARRPFYESFMAAKPLSATQELAQAKKEERDFVRMVLRQIEADDSTTVAPVAVPVPAKPVTLFKVATLSPDSE